MNKRSLILVLILAGFGALSAWAMLSVGYVGIWRAGTAGPGSIQILVDLVIACVLAATWMVRDARERGVTAWPYVLITLSAGSFGPLLYLLRREWGRPA